MSDADAYWTMFSATDHWDCGGWTTDRGEVVCACGVLLGHAEEAQP